MEPERFYDLTRSSRKILIPDLGFLGDTLHLFPALRDIRDAYPRAELHVMAADHVKDLLQLLPWIDRTWGYPRFPTSPPWYRLLPLFQKVKQQNFDTVINLNGSSRSSFLTAWTGAGFRLGRMPERQKRVFWTKFYTHRVSTPYDSTPVYEQRRTCLRQAGVPIHPEALWDVTLPEKEKETVAALLGESGTFIHVSPFTTLDAKELSPDRLVRFLNDLAGSFPDEKIVLTCAPNPREREKLEALLPRLKKAPFKCFPGTLSTLEACALIGRAKLHVGGDSGGVHIAVMQKIPTVIWFREHHPLSGWAPRGPHDHLVFGQKNPEGFLQIDPESLLSEIRKALSN